MTKPTTPSPDAGTYDEFVRHAALLKPAIKALEDEGKDKTYIADLLVFVANWMRPPENEDA